MNVKNASTKQNMLIGIILSQIRKDFVFTWSPPLIHNKSLTKILTMHVGIWGLLPVTAFSWTKMFFWGAVKMDQIFYPMDELYMLNIDVYNQNPI